MSWYEFEARHGPGHQSTSKEYVWFDPQPSEDILQNWYDYWCESERFDWPKGGWENLGENLPEDIRQEQIAKYLDEKDSAEYMLRILHAEGS